jgi:hypothetical protein
MPSFRLELEIGGLRPGRAPNEVMDAARAALAGHHVDATDIAVTGGTPRILIRFTLPDSSAIAENQAARLAAVGARDAVNAVAGTGQLWVLRRRGGRWLPLG